MQTTMPDNTNRNIFRFFDLPAELRDEVYDLSFHTKTTSFCCLEAKAKNLPASNLLTVSHQFNTEYQARANAHKSTLTITETKYCNSVSNHGIPVLPSQISQIVNLKFNLTIFIPRDLPRAKDLLDSAMGKMPRVEKLMVRFNQRKKEHNRDGWALGLSLKWVQKWLNGDWVDVPQLESLEVHVQQSETEQRDYGTRNLYMAWSRAAGTVEVVEGAEALIQ